jgi:2-dehydro-3-deoxygluconokinase
MPEYDLVSLGELMLRLSPHGRERLRQANALVVRPCGAQFNVAADLAVQGKRSAFVSKLPDSELGLLARSLALRSGVDMSHVALVPDTRMGVIYVDFPAEPGRASHVYDRQGSAASAISPNDFDWQNILAGARLAHTDGIFVGLNENCRATALQFIRAAKTQGCSFCFDVNYREMTGTPEQARGVYSHVLPCVDILVTNRFVSESMFGYQGSDEDLARRYRDEFGCRTVCVTAREIHGSARGTWNSIALHEDRICRGNTVEFEIVDRFGAGDAFFAGFLCGYLSQDVQFGLDYGNALCALAHSVEGDVAEVSPAEVMDIVNHGYVTRVRR